MSVEKISWKLIVGLVVSVFSCEGTKSFLELEQGVALLAVGGDAGIQVEISHCGNGQVERGETCEPPDQGDCDSSCQDRPPRCGDNELQGQEECDDGNKLNGDGCSAECLREECGNMRVEGGEQCDPPNGVSCDRNCETIAPSRCGDRVVDLGEECDDGNELPGDGCGPLCLEEVCGNLRIDGEEECEPPGQGVCAADCYLLPIESSTCGNAVQESGETCDDANAVGGDGCSATCQLEECGNEIVDQGEQCEPPAVGVCGATCQLIRGAVPACGDGLTSDAEECDDGGGIDGDGCSALCRLEVCGNGRLDFGETCEPPGSVRCSDTCARHACGNGQVEGMEECDDGNLLVGDGCDSQCRQEYCGNGRVDPALGEQCERPGVGRCTEECRFLHAVCGNGRLEPPESCDDGNLAFGDGCNQGCRIEVCGNGVLDFPGECEPPGIGECGDSCRPFTSQCGDGELTGKEECEDGNWVNGDGCDANCRLEGCGNGRVEPARGEQCEPPNSQSCTSECLIVAQSAAPVRTNKAQFRQVNPGFDESLVGWIALAGADVVHSVLDRNAGGSSGSALIAGAAASAGAGIAQCVRVVPGVRLAVSVQLRAFEVSNVEGTIAVEFFDGSACSGQLLSEPSEQPFAVDENWTAIKLQAAADAVNSGQAPFAAQSARVALMLGNVSVDSFLLVDDATIVLDSEPVCGNSLGEVGEDCEPAFDAGCSPGCRYPVVCGDGIVSAPEEQCEPGLQLATCRADTCQFVTSTGCGNGLVEAGEACDPPSLLSGCGMTCERIQCGNGLVEPPEQCDDADATHCTASCQLVTEDLCGNGQLDPGEQCDPPQLLDPQVLCSLSCRSVAPPVCGNGQLELTEQCEPVGDQDPNCTADCRIVEAVCQDGQVQVGETCDPPDGVFCQAGCRQSQCAECLGSQCAAPTAVPDLFAACDELQGVAADGPARGQPRAALCREAVQCMVSTGCAQHSNGEKSLWSASSCYCGAHVVRFGGGATGTRVEIHHENLLACRDALEPAIGSCRQQFERAAESRVPSQILAALQLGEGLALQPANDLLENCAFAGEPGACAVACAADQATCGNGILEQGEVCDPGDSATGENCDSTHCTILPCGNGVVDRKYPANAGPEPAAWQQEDCDVADPLSRERCTDECLLRTTCGDGIAEGKEQCDPGPLGNWNKCDRGNCTVSASCGNGLREGSEECDEGQSGSSECGTDCKFRGACAECSRVFCEYQFAEWEVRHLEPYRVAALSALDCMSEEPSCARDANVQCICGDIPALFCQLFGGGQSGVLAAGLPAGTDGGRCYGQLQSATESSCADAPLPSQCITQLAVDPDSGFGAAWQMMVCRRSECATECGLNP